MEKSKTGGYKKPDSSSDLKKSGAFKKSGSYKKSGALRRSGSFKVTGAMPRLEDLINDLVALDKNAGASYTLPLVKREAAPSAPVTQSAVAAHGGKGGVPADVREELHLPAQPENQYEALVAFHRGRRHNPLIIMASGRVVYIEYDNEMERIRLFLGEKKRLRRMIKSAFETSALFVIDEVYEYQLQSGEKKPVLETHRQGRELLGSKEAADPNIQPLLHVTLFNQAKVGVSSCKVRGGQDLSSVSRINE